MAAAACGSAVLPARARRGSGTTIAVAGAGPDDDYGRGALLGIEEGRRSVELLRRPLELLVVELPTPSPTDHLLDRILGAGALGLVAALPADRHEAVERAAAAAGVVVLDARARRPDSVERPGVFRTGLPEEAYVTAADAAGIPAAEVVLWEPRLFRYGAEQLNERYRRRFGTGMTGEAWAGWMAVKALTEAALRAGDGGPAALLERLGGSRSAFDGHKGTPLAFTAPGGTLAQPLYVIGPGEPREVAWPLEEDG